MQSVIKGLYVNAVSRIHSLETYQHIANTDVGHEQSVICQPTAVDLPLVNSDDCAAPSQVLPTSGVHPSGSAAPCQVLPTTDVHPSGSAAPCQVLPTTEVHPIGSTAPCQVLPTTDVHPSGSAAPCQVLPTTEVHPSGMTDGEDCCCSAEGSCEWLCQCQRYDSCGKEETTGEYLRYSFLPRAVSK